MNPADLIPYEKGTKVAPRGNKGKVGVLTGAHHRCQMEGCRGLRLTTRWPRGRITHPCTKGMVYGRKGWRIL